MGASGVGPFENDTAADWLSQLDEAIPATLSLTFRPVIAIEPDLYLEEPEASEAVAAAEIVAGLRDQAGPALEQNLEAMGWVVGHKEWLTADLVREAIAAVERVRASSELRDLWSETEDMEAWLHQLDDLLLRLRR